MLVVRVSAFQLLYHWALDVEPPAQPARPGQSLPAVEGGDRGGRKPSE
jgi:hypothetical protein